MIDANLLWGFGSYLMSEAAGLVLAAACGLTMALAVWVSDAHK